MKKSLVIFAITLGFTATSLQASNFVTNPYYDSLEVGMSKYSSVNLFCLSIAKGDTELVKKFIEMGEDVNKKSNGLTPAMYAAKYNRVEILQMLVAHGANLKVKCDKGYTAHQYAEATNAHEAKALIENVLEMF